MIYLGGVSNYRSYIVGIITLMPLSTIDDYDMRRTLSKVKVVIRPHIQGLLIVREIIYITM